MNTRMLVEAEAPSVLLRQELNVYVKDWSELILQGTGNRTDATMSQDAITKALALKADKSEVVKRLSGNNIVYINNSAGNLSSLLFATGAVASSIVQRDSAGRITATAAASDNQVTTLSQVRGMITAGPSLLIVQTEGQNTGYVMSQKAVTDSLNAMRFEAERQLGLISQNVEDIDLVNKRVNTTESDINNLEAKDTELQQAINKNAADITTLNTKTENLDSATKTNAANIDKKLDKTGGTITGSLTITQNLTVQGTTTTHQSQILTVKDPLIVANSDKTTLSSYGGLLINTDSTNTYGLVYDPSAGTVKLGLGTYNSTTKKFAFNSGEGLPVVVRDDSTAWTNGHYAKWDSTKNAFVDGGLMPTIPSNYVTTDSTQTITGAKTFNNAVVFKGVTKIGNTQYATDKIVKNNTTYNLPDTAGTILVDNNLKAITTAEIDKLFIIGVSVAIRLISSSQSATAQIAYLKLNDDIADANNYDYKSTGVQLKWEDKNGNTLTGDPGSGALTLELTNIAKIAFSGFEFAQNATDNIMITSPYVLPGPGRDIILGSQFISTTSLEDNTVTAKE